MIIIQIIIANYLQISVVSIYIKIADYIKRTLKTF